MKIKKLTLVLIIFLYGNLCMGQSYIKEAVQKNNEAAELMRFLKKENIRKATLLFKEAVAIDSTYRLAYINMIQSMMMQKKIEDAMEIVNTAFKYTSEDADLYFIKGMLFAKLHQRVASKEMFQTSIALIEKKLNHACKSYMFFKRALAQSFKGDKYIAFVELLAAQFFFYDMTFDLNTWKIYQSELKYILNFERNKEVREFWTLTEIAAREEYVIDYDR